MAKAFPKPSYHKAPKAHANAMSMTKPRNTVPKRRAIFILVNEWRRVRG
jgi:hypothetical protein